MTKHQEGRVCGCMLACAGLIILALDATAEGGLVLTLGCGRWALSKLDEWRAEAEGVRNTSTLPPAPDR